MIGLNYSLSLSSKHNSVAAVVSPQALDVTPQ